MTAGAVVLLAVMLVFGARIALACCGDCCYGAGTCVVSARGTMKDQPATSATIAALTRQRRGVEPAVKKISAATAHTRVLATSCGDRLWATPRA